MKDMQPDCQPVLDFVQYHNPDRTGYPCELIAMLRVLTNKPVSRLPGNRVWLIGGRGRPRRYVLCSMFIVDTIGDSERAGFRYFVGGDVGHLFHPALPLDHLAWFGRLLRRQANFSLGLRALAPDDAAALATLARSAGIEPPEVHDGLRSTMGQPSTR